MLRRTTILAALVVLSTGLCNAVPTLNPANGHYYEVISEYLYWSQARTAADSLSYMGYFGHLATITSAEEDKFVVGILGERWAWVGGYQDTAAPDYSEPGGGWRWVTGEPWFYENWLGGEPNDSNGEEDRLQMQGPDGYWNDTRGHERFRYLVEYELLPELPSFLTLGIGLVGFVAIARRRSK